MRHMWKRDKGGIDCSTDRGKWAAEKKSRIEQNPDRKRNECATDEGEKKKAENEIRVITV